MFTFKQNSETADTLSRIDRAIAHHQERMEQRNYVRADRRVDQLIERAQELAEIARQFQDSHPIYRVAPLSDLRQRLQPFITLRNTLEEEAEYFLRSTRTLNERRCKVLHELTSQSPQRSWTKDDIAGLQYITPLAVSEEHVKVRFSNLSVTPFPEAFPELVMPIDDITVNILPRGEVRAEPDENTHNFYYSGDMTPHPHGLSDTNFCFGDFDPALNQCVESNDLPTFLLLLQQFFNTVAPTDDAGKSWALPLLDKHLPDVVSYCNIERMRSLIIMKHGNRLVFVTAIDSDVEFTIHDVRDRAVAVSVREDDDGYNHFSSDDFIAGQYTTEDGWEYIDVELAYY